VSYLTHSIIGDADSPSHLARARETETRLEAGLRTLRPVYREVICLRAYCRMSYREIAKAMGLPSEKTASVLFLRARAELRKRL
jgi:RNA polymerase sigma factor (sigma-70 family)